MIPKVFFASAWLKIRVYCYRLIGKEPPVSTVETPKKIIFDPPASIEPKRPIIKPPVQPINEQNIGNIAPSKQVLDIREVEPDSKNLKHKDIETQEMELPAKKPPLPVVIPQIQKPQKRRFRFSVTAERKREALSKLQDSSVQAQSGELFNHWRQQSGYPPIWLEDLNLKGLKLRGIDWKNCFLHRVQFAHANLEKASFKAAVLRQVDFHQADLTGADFTGLDLSLVTGLHPDQTLNNELRINPWLKPPMLEPMLEIELPLEQAIGMYSQLDLDQMNIDQQNQKKAKRGGDLSPDAQIKAEKAELLYKEGRLSAGEISQALGISKTTFYRYLKLRNVKITKASRKKS